MWLAAAGAHADCGSWPQWEDFRHDLLSADGRVIDASTARQHSTSEGQSYALFFALVANDRDTFERVLQWTGNNLAAGDLSSRLPAWQWGRRDDGSWGVIDANAASDADVWIAYSLAEAARLWNVRRYRILSKAIAQRILAEETATLPGLGLVLLPAPQGFTPAPGKWRLNPSYLPLQALRGLARYDGRWNALAASSAHVIVDSAPRGYAPDWTLYDGSHFLPDADTRGIGSYNAIRVYLWAGMLDAADPARAVLLRALNPMAQYVAGHRAPPESVEVSTGETHNDGPAGFSGALVPFLSALADSSGAATQATRARQSLGGLPKPYYGSALNLFGLGYAEGRYRFDAGGQLHPRWEGVCK
ncbi:MAG TPA: cellulose synthase complex periplasmic endoglucanase BcsZ [Nevskiaceae bacterium]|nr:cellulose synthase complex periplasmic endoglucanase BcsZ [Nevskiaceae bacterium]